MSGRKGDDNEPRLTKPAQVHHTVFQAGLPESAVIECAQRHYEWRQVGPAFYPPGAASQQQLVRDEVVRQQPQRDRDAELRAVLSYARAGLVPLPSRPQAQAGDLPPEQEMSLVELTDEAERIAVNMEKAGRYAARTIMRELVRRLQLPQAPDARSVDENDLFWLSDAIHLLAVNGSPTHADRMRGLHKKLIAASTGETK